MISEALSAIKDSHGIEERCYLVDEDKNIVRFDVVESESWSASTSVASYPIEKGEDISDHIKVNAETVSVKSTLTNHTGIDSLKPDTLSRIQGMSKVEDIASERMAQLYEWRNKGTLLSYFGAVKDPVENMIITSLTPSKDGGTGEAIEVSINMQRVVIAEYKELQIGLPQAARATVKKGLARLESLSVNVDIVSNSILSSLF